MNLPAEMLSLLKDEAYAALCREALESALGRLHREKETLIRSRIGGAPADPAHVATFDLSLRTAVENESALTARLHQLAQIEGWLHDALSAALADHLPDTSAEFRASLETAAAVGRWQSAIEGLIEPSRAVERQAHAVAEELAAGRRLELGTLRIALRALQAALDEVGAAQKEFIALCDSFADALQLPPVPGSFDELWIQQLKDLTPAEISTALVRCEYEARVFSTAGVKRLLTDAAEIREACLDASQAVLMKHWRMLRIHARSHFIEQRNLDEVLLELDHHRRQAQSSPSGETAPAGTVA